MPKDFILVLPPHLPIDPDMLLKAIDEWQQRYPEREVTPQVVAEQITFVLRYYALN